MMIMMMMIMMMMIIMMLYRCVHLINHTHDKAGAGMDVKLRSGLNILFSLYNAWIFFNSISLDILYFSFHSVEEYCPLPRSLVCLGLNEQV